MAETRRARILRYSALFVGVVALSLFFRMLPLSAYGPAFPAPDLLLCLTMAWVVRRPDYLPAPLIAAAFFLEDLLLMRPPGLMALLVLLGTEFLRRRNALIRGLPFWLEYALVATVLTAIFLGNRLILAIVMVPQVPLGLSFAQFVGTVLLYPLAVLVSHFVLGVRKPATGEVDALGQKL